MDPTTIRDESAPLPIDQSPPADTSRLNRVLFLLTLSVTVNYLDRSNLSIAAPLLKDELHLSASQLGTLLSAFFWTYACLQIPAGWLVDRLDVKWVFAAGFYLWSAATAVTGILHSFAALVAIRVILGVGESVAFPSYSKILGNHFRGARCGFANSVVMAGLALGPALGMLVGGNIVGRFGWRPFFLALGFSGFLWLIPWSAWMPSSCCSSTLPTRRAAGVLQILRQRSAWGTCIIQFCFNYSLYLLVTWLPFYLVRSRNLSMTRMATVGALLFFFSAASSLLFGKLSDWWADAGGDPTYVRKSPGVLGMIGLGAFLALAPIVPDNLSVWTLVGIGVFNGMATSNLWAVTQILAGPSMVGRWAGAQNFVGNLAGSVAPAVTGFLLDRTGHFSAPFFLAAAIVWCGILSWLFVVGKVEEACWESEA
ncbi:MAG TPA: MFS transporter [Terriglobales bacterium]|nr:MFS transporter [Terriglobales bacterium]